MPVRNSHPVRLFTIVSSKEERSNQSGFMHNMDLNIKSLSIKYADDTEVDSMIDNDAEVTQSNVDSLVSRMNTCN